MTKLKCYYAHTMVSYGSTIEQQDLALLNSLGFEVINPNTPEHAKYCKEYAEVYGKENVMEYFKALVEDCDMVAFRGLPNGDILSGISAELQRAIELNLPIIELPCSIESRMMDYPETKQYLIELGHYKTK